MSRLLCASANPNWSGFYSGILGAAGHDAPCLNTLAEAIAELRRGTSDLVITDLSFDSDSFLVISIAIECGIPVIVVFRNIAKVFRPPYADLYLEPPIAPQELLAIIQQLLTTRIAPAEPKKQVAVA